MAGARSPHSLYAGVRSTCRVTSAVSASMRVWPLLLQLLHMRSDQTNNCPAGLCRSRRKHCCHMAILEREASALFGICLCLVERLLHHLLIGQLQASRICQGFHSGFITQRILGGHCMAYWK